MSGKTNGAMLTLIENTVVVEHDCNWCGASAGIDVHSRGCILGERHAQYATLLRGGLVGWPKGRPFMSRQDFLSTRAYRRYLRFQRPGFRESAERQREAGLREYWNRSDLREIAAEQRWLESTNSGESDG
jgi:hypothetical protein